MKSFVTKSFCLLLLLLNPSVILAVGLPVEFAIEAGTQGVELVWSSNSTDVRIGGSRPEFRITGGVIFGYPREIQGQLHLAISSKDQETLETEGPSLQVWSSGRRIDIGGASNVAKAAAAAVAANFDAPPPKTPTVLTNPAKPGNFTTRRSSYNLANVTVDEFPFPIEVIAEVTDPVRAAGKRPLILFLHGRHETCYLGGPPDGVASGNWPCPAGWLPIPSYKGYRYIADILASQGYIVVSISANGINGQDFNSKDGGTTSRSVLIRRHLSLWAQWNSGGDPWGGRFLGRLDMNQVVLVGHSRGGEGVNRAAIDATISDPYKIVGLVSFGPTAIGHQVTPDVHSATILPTCDGDVSDLQGQAYIDASRECVGSTTSLSTLPICGDGNSYYSPHWQPISSRPSPQALELTWKNRTNAFAQFVVRNSQSNLTALDWVDVRIANDPDLSGVRFDVLVSDKSG
jgi:hypothetical protein